MSSLAVCVFGAPMDSGNRGVEALARSILTGLRTATPRGRVTLFDNGWGIRQGEGVDDLAVDYCGVRDSRRIYRSESWTNVNVSLKVPWLRNVVAERIRSCDLVLDISGGDSFSDIYGMDRFRRVLQPKHAALEAGRPLALLPQTYGPYTDPNSERRAVEIVRRAAVAWSRDDESFDVLVRMLGSEFDPERHRRGVDLAFALEARRPTHVPAPLDELVFGPRTVPVVGVNVSGLLETSGAQFDLNAKYVQAMRSIVARLAQEAHVVLVPHVRAPGGAGESDRPAAQRLMSSLDKSVAHRIHIAPDSWRADELKWLIAQLDWFCGARMHATIAALSTATPVCAIAYSRKFRGVFQTCDAEDLVADARSLATHDLIEWVLESYSSRAHISQRLSETASGTVDLARKQIPIIVETAFAVARG